MDHDFWLIDDRDGIRMHYYPDGRFLGAGPVGSDQVLRYQHCRDAAVAAAEPFVTWWARHPEERQDHRAA